MKNKNGYTLLLIIVSIIWGSTFFIIKDATSNIDEALIVFFRTCISFILLFFYLLCFDRKLLLDKKAFIHGTILGLLLSTSYLTQTIGLKYTSTGHSAFITGGSVILVSLILRFFFKKKLSNTDIYSVVILFIGLFLLTYDLDTKINKGDMITITTAFTRAIHITLVGKYFKKSNLLSMITYQFLIASILSIIIWITKGSTLKPITMISLLPILYLSVVGTLLCYIVSIWVQKYLNTLRVSIILSTEPVFATIFSYFFINEKLNPTEIMGALLMLTAILFHQIFNQNKISSKSLLKQNI